jgi:large subunit ribosomal protein L18
MASKKPKQVLYRRKMEGRTNYSKRLSLLLSKKLRLIVRFTNQRVIAQVCEFNSQSKGDKILAAVDSFALKKHGWTSSCKNLPAAYLTGLLIAKTVSSQGHKEAILDTGLRTPVRKGKIYAFLKGALDGGMDIPHGGEDIYPEEDRLFGKHIKEDLPAQVKKVKEKIMSN